MEPHFFETQELFRKWLDDNHQSHTEFFVGLHKIKSGKPSMTYSQAVDQALCYGWIDGITRRIDEDSYQIRFTPRRADSIWSAVNIAKVAELTKNGLMKPAGIDAYAKRTEAKSKIYSFENEAMKLDTRYESQFRENKKAWEFFTSQPPGYQRLNIYRIMTAKQEKTQQSRLEKLIEASKDQKRID